MYRSPTLPAFTDILCVELLGLVSVVPNWEIVIAIYFSHPIAGIKKLPGLRIENPVALFK
jgi:hypothetical protein